MAGFGAFAPMPLRLGRDAKRAWPAEAHARLCADLLAVKRTLPFAVLTYTISGSTATIDSYVGMNGIGTDAAPSISAVTIVGAGAGLFVWDRFYEDAYEVPHPVFIRAAKHVGTGSSALIGTVTLDDSNPHQLSTTLRNAAGSRVDGSGTVIVW